jgi:hypothetical protein
MSNTTTTTISHTTAEQDLICMIEGCNAIGEEVIGLLDEDSISEDVDKYDDNNNDDEYTDATGDAGQGNNFENNERDNLIPAVVCGKHFDKLVEDYYCQEPSKEAKNKQI